MWVTADWFAWIELIHVEDVSPPAPTDSLIINTQYSASNIQYMSPFNESSGRLHSWKGVMCVFIQTSGFNTKHLKCSGLIIYIQKIMNVLMFDIQLCF